MRDTTSEVGLAPMNAWLAMPIEPAARDVIDRVRRSDDVVRVAVMPDVHLATDVCVGTVVATERLVYPSAVGGRYFQKLWTVTTGVQAAFRSPSTNTMPSIRS
jgi:hypothetical protein